MNEHEGLNIVRIGLFVCMGALYRSLALHPVGNIVEFMNTFRCYIILIYIMLYINTQITYEEIQFLCSVYCVLLLEIYIVSYYIIKSIIHGDDNKIKKGNCSIFMEN